MRNWIIINGVNSQNIQGLLIQELPPITKPPMRVQTQVTDGQDGDSRIDLGYGAYDKTLKIGLYGDFNVDEVIEYFAQSGTIVFSNEPNFVYQFSMNQQINFERLVRFRTANIILHTQPFKHSLAEQPMTININKLNLSNTTITGSGIVANINNGVINVQGTGTIQIPISITCKGQWKLSTYTTGTINGTFKIKNSTDTFGTINLESGYQEISANVNKTYTIIEISTENGNFAVNYCFTDKSNIVLYNLGNIASMPIFSLYGEGQVSVSNEDLMFTATLNSGLTIDYKKKDAYIGNQLFNRQVLTNFKPIPKGKNVLTWTGLLKSIKIENISRWL